MMKLWIKKQPVFLVQSSLIYTIHDRQLLVDQIISSFYHTHKKKNNLEIQVLLLPCLYCSEHSSLGRRKFKNGTFDIWRRIFSVFLNKQVSVYTSQRNSSWYMMPRLYCLRRTYPFKFFKAVFHKFYLVHSWTLWPIPNCSWTFIILSINVLPC